MQSAITSTSVPHELELKIKTAIELKKQLEEYEKEIKDTLQKAMIQNNIINIKNDSYTISLVKRTSYSPETDELPEAFIKTTLDTTKVSMHEKLYGSIPEGITKKETKYITWRAK